MPCSQDHFIPILDELDQRIREAEAREARRKRRACPEPRRRGGPRPGSGPPRGNLNALKHGRYSSRHRFLLETLLDVPEAQQALLDINRRHRQRQRNAEIEAAYLLMRWLATHNPEFLSDAMDQSAANLEAESDTPLSREVGEGPGVRARENDQTQNDQLSDAIANLEASLKRRISRKTTKKRTPKPKERPNDAPPPS